MTLRAKGQVTLPEEVRSAARLEEGDLLERATQAWFWTPDWQAGERAADADRDAGRSETFESAEAFVVALHAATKPASDQ